MAEPRQQFGMRQNSRAPPNRSAGTPQSSGSGSGAQGGLFDRLEWWHGAIAIAVGVTVLGVAALFIGGEGEGEASKVKAKGKQPSNKKTKSSGQSASQDKDVYKILLQEAKKAQKANDFTKSEKYYEKALKAVQKVLGDNETLIVYYLWSTLYATTKQDDKREEKLLLAVEVVRKATSPAASSVIVLSALADFYIDKERYNEAKGLCDEQLSIAKQVFATPDHANIGYASGQLAHTMWKLEDYEKAEEHFTNCLRILKKNNAIDVLYYKHVTAVSEMLVECGRNNEAIALLKKELEFVKSSSAGRGSTAVYKQALANVYYQSGDSIKALEMFDDAYKSLITAAGQQHRALQQLANSILTSIINICWELKKIEEAESYEELLKSISADAYFPHTASQYMQTHWAKLNEEEFSLKISIFKRISEPKLKSGNVLEFVFENPNGDTVSVDRVITTEDLSESKIEIKYPDFASQEFVVKVGDWLGATIYIWSDNSKSDKIGLHRQLARMDTPEMQKRYLEE